MHVSFNDDFLIIYHSTAQLARQIRSFRYVDLNVICFKFNLFYQSFTTISENLLARKESQIFRHSNAMIKLA